MNRQVLAKAVEALTNGDLVVYPTDTLYGLGADVFNEDAVKKVFSVKNRSFDNPLSIAVATFEDLKDIAFVDDRVKTVVECFLPGSLTLVLKKKDTVSDIVTGGLDNVAIRIPDDPFALRLLSVFGPLTCTSANIHGKDTPHVINDIRMQFKEEDIALYIDAGKLDGKPSTIVDLTDDEIKILREGDISKKQILDAIKDE